MKNARWTLVTSGIYHYGTEHERFGSVSKDLRTGEWRWFTYRYGQPTGKGVAPTLRIAKTRIEERAPMGV